MAVSVWGVEHNDEVNKAFGLLRPRPTKTYGSSTSLGHGAARGVGGTDERKMVTVTNTSKNGSKGSFTRTTTARPGGNAFAAKPRVRKF